VNARRPLLSLVLALAAPLGLVACGDPKPTTPTTDPTLYAAAERAYHIEITEDSAQSEAAWLDALERVAEADGDPFQLPVALAALDALVYRNVSAYSGARSALAFRVGAPKTDARLGAIAKKAKGTFVPGLVARARTTLAEVRGNAEGAAVVRRDSGCATAATVLGPIRATRLSELEKPSALERYDALVPTQTTSPGPFGRTIAPETVAASDCRLELGAVSSQTGTREVVVDVEVPAQGRVGLMIATRSPMHLRAGGSPVLTRPLATGGGESLHFAEVAATPGKLRVVARVGQSGSQDALAIHAFSPTGAPLVTTAPKAGDFATSKATEVRRVSWPTKGAASKTRDGEDLVLGLAELSARLDRDAETRLAAAAARAPGDPALSLAYARAIRNMTDLEPVHVSERARVAYERALEKAPGAWEAVVELASLAGQRRAEGEARIVALKEIEKRAAGVKGGAADLVLAFEALEAGNADLHDRAKNAREALRTKLGGSVLFESIDRETTQRRGPESLAFECQRGPNRDATSLRCYVEKRLAADTQGAEAELTRLRGLFGAPRYFLSGSLRDAMYRGDKAMAKRLYDALPEGEKTVAFLHATSPDASLADVWARALRASDAPASLPGVLSAKGASALSAFDGIAEKVTEADRKEQALPTAGTAVLVHEERYAVSPEGVTTYVLFDVRRLTGTADVESHAQAAAPSLGGRATTRTLRRRIFKKDGRILTPDQTPRASQAHADLSQLEAGDYVEAIYTGVALPNDRGDVAFDTTDLLPERTGVAKATLEIRLPTGKPFATFSHPLLGKATERTEGGTRILSYSLTNRLGRRFEDGTPKMDRSCNFSLSSARWSDLGESLAETVASLDDRGSPEVSAWIAEASTKDGKRLEGRALVDALVAASGQALKVASAPTLSDYELGRTESFASQTARTMLTRHEGSRTWLVVRALRELGIPAEIIVAEDFPFSSDPAYPPHLGRFTHPLAWVHLTTKNPNGSTQKEDVIVDADVQGPPLPAGRVSPELRGRSALLPSGAIVPLPKQDTGGERDEVDLRLTIDESGNAKGSLTVLVRGRSAQQLAEAFVRVVGADRQRALQGIALAWVPFASVDKVELSSREGSWEVAIRAEISVGSYAQAEAQGTWVLPGLEPVHIVYPRPYVATLGNLYTSQSGRQGAFAVDRAVQFHVRRRVELPKGAKIVRQPGPFEIRSPELDAQRLMRVDGAVIEEDFTLNLPTGTLSKERYATFAQDARKTDDGFLASLRVDPKKAPDKK